MKREQVGGKAYNLYLLQKAGIPVAPFDVVDSAKFLQWNATLLNQIPASLNEESYSAFSKQVNDHFLELTKNELVQTSLSLANLFESKYYAIRSSGTEEDGANSSFAGQFETFLFVTKNNIFEKIIQCWKSRFSYEVLSYVQNKSISNYHFPMAVMIQAMVNCDRAGVMLTANVDNQEPYQTVISASYGIGEGLVSGIAEADTYIVSQENNFLIHKKITEKESMLVPNVDSDGTQLANVPLEFKNSDVLSRKNIVDLNKIAIKIEKLFHGRPQDIEWGYQDQHLYIMQSRDLTTWSDLNKNQPFELWDSSNIGESYHGVVSPMTFSFTRGNYHHLFEACLIDLGSKPQDIKKYQKNLEGLLGHYQGYLYYRLTNWKKILYPLPGGSIFMRFLSSFIGSQGEIDREYSSPSMAFGSAIKVIAKLIYRYHFRKKLNKKFEDQYSHFSINQWKRFEIKEDEETVLGEIKSFYEKLFTFWYMPTYNDLFSVVSVGIFETLIRNAFSKRSLIEQTEIKMGLLGASKGLGPLWELKKIAQYTKSNSSLFNLISSKPSKELTKLLKEDPEQFGDGHKHYQMFLNHWGFRCQDELILEATDLKEDPTEFFEQLKLQINLNETPKQEVSELNIQLRSVKELIFYPFVLLSAKRARELLDTRESMRIKRSELFAIMRRNIKRLGELWANQYIDSPTDIFFLYLEELSSIPKNEFRNIIQRRKSSWTDEPPERFYMIDNQVIIPKKRATQTNGMVGTPCYGGVVRGPIAIYYKGISINEIEGKILITERSGPGHVSYFPHIKAMVVEKGSTLSHAIIAAREFKLPTIVGIDNLIAQLNAVQEVEVNANTGKVSIITK